MNYKIGIFGAFLVALLTFALDFIFHLFATEPMEVPLYFLAKFAWAFVAALTIPYLRLIRASLLFTLGFDFYYYVGVLVLHANYLSSSPTQIISIAGITDPITLFLLWTFFHGLFFFMAGGAVVIRSAGGHLTRRGPL